MTDGKRERKPGPRLLNAVGRHLVRPKKSAIEERCAGLPVAFTVRRVKEIRDIMHDLHLACIGISGMACGIEQGLDVELLRAVGSDRGDTVRLTLEQWHYLRALDEKRNKADAVCEAAEEVLRISDRKHDAWDALRCAIAEYKGCA